MAPLEVCPHMAARCPLKRAECDDDASSKCHFIFSAWGTAATASLLKDQVDLPDQVKDLLKSAQAFAEGSLE